MAGKRWSAALWGTAIAAAAVFLVARQGWGSEPLETVGHVDLGRYAGRWFEVARLPLHWENKCAADVTATYTLRANGSVNVLNECRTARGEMTRSHGTAKVAAKDGSNAKLKVTFFWPFAGDYWILQLDPEYQWALVGTPNRKYLWVLSRTPTLDREVMERLRAWAKERGFPVEKMMVTRQG